MKSGVALRKAEFGAQRRRIPNVGAQTGSRRFTWCGRDCSYLAPLQRRVTRSSLRTSKSDGRVARLGGYKFDLPHKLWSFVTFQYIIKIRIAAATV